MVEKIRGAGSIFCLEISPARDLDLNYLFTKAWPRARKSQITCMKFFFSVLVVGYASSFQNAPVIKNAKLSQIQSRSRATAANPETIPNADRELKKAIDKDFWRIGLPSLVQFTASPLCALIDSMLGLIFLHKWVIARISKAPRVRPLIKALLRCSLSLGG